MGAALTSANMPQGINLVEKHGTKYVLYVHEYTVELFESRNVALAEAVSSLLRDAHSTIIEMIPVYALHSLCTRDSLGTPDVRVQTVYS